jgi:hypothetical protein
MNIHSQQARKMMGWILGIVALSPLALCYQSLYPRVALSDVTGRVTCSGRPLTGTIIYLVSDSGNDSAIGKLESDGSFRLLTTRGRVGAFPGLYHAFFYSRKGGPPVPAKFSDPVTSGLEIEIASGWNDLNIDLH